MHDTERELVLTRDIDAPREHLWRCWTEPALITQWFCPKPWAVSHAETDVRPGGGFSMLMRGPEGQEFPNQGVYLEVVRNERLVGTDAYTAGWQPSAKPFMTLILTFEALAAERTRYTALVRHWTVDDRKQHEAMGFHTGWGIATDQLAELAGRL